ncbi:unnamed protein product [Cuscuta europaea]|uniref:Uncharacterized protein n=1 Tax=Cuscuta europaea TaxID=41803 RepID=A0A9P1E4C1_CUSEU|nr:unnamed protein product [Cuscuta europaea]
MANDEFRETQASAVHDSDVMVTRDEPPVATCNKAVTDGIAHPLLTVNAELNDAHSDLASADNVVKWNYLEMMMSNLIQRIILSQLPITYPMMIIYLRKI